MLQWRVIAKICSLLLCMSTKSELGRLQKAAKDFRPAIITYSIKHAALPACIVQDSCMVHDRLTSQPNSCHLCKV